MVCPHGRPSPSYFFLLRALHKKEFYSFVPNDDNRAEDGKEFRRRFANFDGPCSILEMMIALSDRVAQEFVDTIYEAPPEKWFWEMIDNLGLATFTDDKFLEGEGGVWPVDNILDGLLERTYDETGKGGLFPLKNPPNDQRKIEIWYQMHKYIIEKLGDLL